MAAMKTPFCRAALPAALLLSANLAAAPSVIPVPASLQAKDGAPFVVTAQTRLQANVAATPVANWFARWSGLQLDASGAAEINLAVEPALTGELGAEGYRLTSSAGGVAIRGATPAGVFYGVQTLRQLLPPDMERGGIRATNGRAEIPALEITDRPRFGWRGALLDVGRHFVTVENVKRFLDEMALHKLNVLHWHLTEDQGWRLEIKKYPKLTSVGAWRASSPVAGGNKVDDGVPHGGFYTQDEVREIVAYAAARFIRVMPEIELPGHSSAAIASYPELGNTDAPGYAPTVQVRWGIFPYLYAPKPETFRFLDDVLTEVLDLFPGEFIHIGGDEAKKDQWNASPTAQAFIQANHLQDAHELQSYFIRRAEKFLSAHGRRLVGWDEIQEGGLAAGATMMAWRDVKWAIAAAREGHDVVLAPTSHTYLDYTEGTEAEEGERVGRQLKLEKVYSFEPVPAELEPQFQTHVLGTQGQLWSEHMQNWPKVEFRAWPRLSALAEVAWSPRERRDFADFKARLPWLLARFDRLGMNYRRPRATDEAPPVAPPAPAAAKPVPAAAPVPGK
jgi:hexosaminidase